ncbi:MAG: YsnF/AvaK domain-containing protein [Chloroflexota bacterium]
MAERYPNREPVKSSGNARAPLPEQLAGCDLNGSDNKSIGKIQETHQGYLHITTGLLGLGGTLYIPRSAIDHCSGNTCYLDIPADQVDAMGWSQKPAEPANQAQFREGAPKQASATPSSTGEAAEQTRRIPLRDEEIEIHKHREKVGEVVIGKEVVEEQRTFNVPVSREEVTIERHTVDQPIKGPMPPVGQESEVVRVPIYEDVVDVEKRAHVHEELVVSPEEVTTQEQVTRTVRREVPEVSTTGEAEKFVRESSDLEENPSEEQPKQQPRRQAR